MVHLVLIWIEIFFWRIALYKHVFLEQVRCQQHLVGSKLLELRTLGTSVTVALWLSWFCMQFSFFNVLPDEWLLINVAVNNSSLICLDLDLLWRSRYWHMTLERDVILTRCHSLLLVYTEIEQGIDYSVFINTLRENTTAKVLICSFQFTWRHFRFYELSTVLATPHMITVLKGRTVCF